MRYANDDRARTVGNGRPAPTRVARSPSQAQVPTDLYARSGSRRYETRYAEKETNMAQTNPKNTQHSEALPPKLIARHVNERGEKAFWTCIGAAWDHKEGEGYTLQLDLVSAN